MFNVAHEHVATNVQLFAPGVSFKELTFGSHQLPEEFIDQRYGCKMNGLGFAMNGRRSSTLTIG
ncbi:MAG: hypothetical protein OSB69_10770 [Alphaproteobacteria bacterium]|nr:hypothetical protein [Alphaproteobacteria bacterium]